MFAATQPRRRRKEARPSELTAAALALFVEKGFAATRLEEIAIRAGVSKGTLYLYFDSKDALFKAVIQEGIVPVVAEGEAIAARHDGSAVELLERLLENWWSRIGETEYAGIPKLMIAEARNFPDVARFYYENVIRRGRALIGAALERGMASGEFRRLEVETTIEVVIAPILMLLIWRFSMAPCLGREIEPRQYLAIHMELLRQGLERSRV
ncbi:MAG: TetR/AcrR family transcriptional regulator [Dechloromonas sp.]|nr:MAG: TetR/AcrR family transcriptional regulator [Dechloromonas sp.]